MTANCRYKIWLDNPNLDPKLRGELNCLSQDEVNEAFAGDLSFGTGGLRGILGVGTNRMNVHVVKRTAYGYGLYLKSCYSGDLGVAISYDNRHFSSEFAKSCSDVLTALGIKTYLFDNLAPTPLLSFAVRNLKLNGGIMITASHNPKEYNGFKAYNHTGAQLSLNESASMMEILKTVTDYFSIPVVKNLNLQFSVPKSVITSYISNVLALSRYSGPYNSLVLYSPFHGTGSQIIPNILKEKKIPFLCYEPHLINCPDFSGVKSSNPEDAIAYEELKIYALNNNIDCILVSDPDADRMGVMVKHQNEFILLTGNQTAAILLKYWITHNNFLQGHVYTTIVTSSLIKEIAQKYHYIPVETLTGYKFIGELAEKYDGVMPYIFGCEESFGTLISAFVRDKDACQAIFVLTEMVNRLKLDNLTLIDYLEEIYQEFGFYYEHTTNLTYPGLKGLEKIKKVMHYFRSHKLLFTEFPLLFHDDYLKQKRYFKNAVEQVDLAPSDVLKFYYQNLWIALRPSGTEPKLKIYFGIKANKTDASKIVKSLEAKIIKLIEGI